MHCTKKITDNLTWIGANDRRLALFEGVYSVPYGVSYNSYLLKDEKTVLFDTVDKAVGDVFIENLVYSLEGRPLDYIILHHMEPDHSATLRHVLAKYPDAKIVCSEKSAAMLGQFFEIETGIVTVKEGETLCTGEHELEFILAPMVHWPEVMMTFDKKTGILFSADAFGAFGALGGAIFADEVDFERDYMDEARRYYANIVGKYGMQVQNCLKKASKLDIKTICPLHGFVWRKNLKSFIKKYQQWSTYTPEETGVVVAYASVYGNTENAAEIVASKLRDKGIKTVMYDVSVTPASEIISDCFKYSHFVFASTTYNNGIFVEMEAFLHDLAAHNIQNRVVGFIENGSWAPVSGKLMKEILAPCKNLVFIDETVSVKSRLKKDQMADIEALVNAIEKTIKKDTVEKGETDTKVFNNISYGLFVLTAKDGEKDNGCIINTVTQITSLPARITVAVNKDNFTHDMIEKTGVFNVSILSQATDFDTIKRFGFASGRDINKFENMEGAKRSKNGVVYITDNTNAFISARVTDILDFETHSVFVAEVTEGEVLSEEPSLTYEYYHKNIKTAVTEVKPGGKKWVCEICGYVYDEEKEGVPFEDLPDSWTCPLCKHPKSDFSILK